MWFPQYAPDGQLTIRHTCEQSDGLLKYGWLKHDGTNFGSQEIVDKDFALVTDFVKRSGGDHGGDWTARISGKEMVWPALVSKYNTHSIFCILKLDFSFWGLFPKHL